MSELIIACVYKTGGEYNQEYVRWLAEGVHQNLSYPHKFLCLTDAPREQLENTQIDGIVPLQYGWPCWWAKLELFKLPGPLLYFDLDTVIVGNIDRLAERIVQDKGSLMVLRGFYRQDQCSGIMGWNADLIWILDTFYNDACKAKFVHRPNAVHMKGVKGSFRGDQEWLRAFLRNQNGQLPVTYAQDFMGGIYSYKVDVRPKGKVPEDARIICFHGKPRPHEVKMKLWHEQKDG